MKQNISLIELKEKYAKMHENKLPCGVSRLSKTRYGSTIRINKTRKYLGCFTTPEEAHAAYLKAKEEYKNG